MKFFFGPCPLGEVALPRRLFWRRLAYICPKCGDHWGRCDSGVEEAPWIGVEGWCPKCPATRHHYVAGSFSQFWTWYEPRWTQAWVEALPQFPLPLLRHEFEVLCQ